MQFLLHKLSLLQSYGCWCYPISQVEDILYWSVFAEKNAA